jgi:hypothetical protein
MVLADIDKDIIAIEISAVLAYVSIGWVKPPANSWKAS